MAVEDGKIVVVGAGLVGSLLAALLAKRGHRVEVYEKRPDPRAGGVIGGRSINLALSDRGWRALELIGADKAVREIALPMKQRIMHGKDGTLTYQPYGKDGQAIYSVSRAILNQTLMGIADSYQNVEFYFGKACQTVDLRSRTLSFSDGENKTDISAEVIFGADGAFSPIRRAMQKAERFNYEQRYISSGYKELEIPPIDGDFALETGALHIWPRGSHMMIALPNPDKTFTATLFLPFEGEKSFEQIKEYPAFESFIKEEFSDVFPLIPDLEEDFNKNPVSSLVTVRCSPWVNNQAALIGDAAHAVVPFYGQGMNCGFEDCYILDGLMEMHGGDWSQVLDEYQNERIDNANAISDLALQNFIEMRDRVADPEFLLQKQMEKQIHKQYPDKWIPLYSMVTFSHIPYREALEKGKRQDEIMKAIMALPVVREKWQDIDFGQYIDFENLVAKSHD